MKKLLTIILSLCLGICALIGLCSCKTISEKTDDRDTDIVAVYDLYVANAKENGETPLSYEEWLQTIKGDKGEKGDSGKDGKSAYQIWLDNGHTGSEADFLEWLKGDTEPQGLDFYLQDDGTYSVAVGKAKELSNIVIPATHNGKPVTKIARNGFQYSDNLKSITIPDSITSIGQEAFGDCVSLTEVVIPDSVNSIGNDTFKHCNALESITIPFIGESRTAKDGYNQVFGFIFGYSDDNPAEDSTYQASSGYGKYYFIPSSIKKVVLQGDISSIDDYSFNNCDKLTEIILPESITYIGDDVFYGCSKLEKLTIPDLVTYIGERSFSDCSKLKNVTIPNRVTYIGNSAFSGCENITSIVIPNSVISIGSRAFSSCNISGITIPDNVTSIGNGAFACSSLKYINVSKGNTKYRSLNNCLIDIENKELIQGCEKSIIPTNGSVTSIGASAFANCDGLTSINIPESITSIGASAFASCGGLTSINIPESITSISNYTFYYCANLKHVIIPDSITTIGQEAFGGCWNLTELTIPNSVTFIDRSAFHRYGYSIPLTITFNDTIAQWESIFRIKSYREIPPELTVHCTDGDWTPSY